MNVDIIFFIYLIIINFVFFMIISFKKGNFFDLKHFASPFVNFPLFQRIFHMNPPMRNFGKYYPPKCTGKPGGWIFKNSQRL